MIRRIPAIVLVCATFLFCSAGSAAASPVTWTTTQVTHDALDHSDAMVSGDRLVWRNSGPNSISTWKAGETSLTLIPSGIGSAIGSMVSGDRVAWWAVNGVPPTHIATWKVGGSSATDVAPMHAESGDMQLDDDRIVWRDKPDAWSRVFTWKVGDSEPTTVSGSGDAGAPQVSGDRVAWYQNDGSVDQIMTSIVGSSSVQLTSVTPFNMNPRVSGDRVAWESQAVDTNWYAFTWTPASGVTTVGPCESWGDGLVRVSGDRIAWLHSDGVAKQVLTWKLGSAPTTITASPTDCKELVLSGNRIAWAASDGANDQVISWAQGDSAPTTVTTNATRHYTLSLSGDRLAWIASDGAYDQIYTAVATPAPLAPLATRLTKPSVSPGTVKRRKTVTFRANLTPGAAMQAAGAKAQLRLYQSATKTVTKMVKGKKKRVKVTYWRLRSTLTMKRSVSGGVAKLSASTKLTRKGSWKAVVSFSGSEGYTASSSVAKTFRVR